MLLLKNFLPPSRFVGDIIIMFFHTFYWILCSYFPILAILFEVFKFFRTKIEPYIQNRVMLIWYYLHISNARMLFSDNPFDKLFISSCFSTARLNDFPKLCIASTVNIILLVGIPKIAYSS